jgi:hypothetical protein
MKSRSGIEICLPALVLVAAGLLSMPTLVLAMLWMFAGAVSIGHRDLRSFPREGIAVRWRWGWRSWFLLIYHLAWWPWYMRKELAQFLTQTRHKMQSHRTPHADDSSGDAHQRNKE